MSEVKQYTIKEIVPSLAKTFVISWHYSHSMPASKVCFGLYRGEDLIGVAVYGDPAMRHQATCYACDIELRRLCIIDDTPKNAESRFIGLTLKALRKKGFKAVLSLADPEHGHQGAIYRASNFECLGEERGTGSRLLVVDGVEMHSRSAFRKFGRSGIKNLSDLLGAHRVSGRNKQRKFVYRYVL